MSKQYKIDYRFTVEIAIFMLVLYGISLCVYLNGDDFMYGAFAHTGILSNVVAYYFTGNGRFWINMLNSALIWFGRFGFILVLPWIVLAFIVLIAKNIQRIMAGQPNRKKEKNLIRMGMVLFCCLDVLCLRESVFWITGMMNYLFPAVLFLWAYLMFQKSLAGELHEISKIGYCLLSFLTASSVEQYALMFVGMLTLHYGFNLINKRRISGFDWLVYALSLFGLAVLILAPGNFVRIDTQSIEYLPVLDNIWTLLYQDFLSPVALPFVIMMSLTMLFQSDNSHKYFILNWFICFFFVLGIIISSFIDKAVIYIIPLAVLGCLLAWQLYSGNISFSHPVWFLLFVGIGSQIMLLISAVWGYRCMLSLYLVYMLVIGCLLYHAETNQRLFVLASGILTAFHPMATLVFWLGTFLLYRKHNYTKKLAAVTTYCGSVAVLVILLIGYSQNVQTHKLNLQSTATIENQTIVIRKLPDDTFSWYFVPISEFHEEYYRIYYEIPENTEIIYQPVFESTSSN